MRVLKVHELSDGNYRAECPSLDISSQGETPRKAVAVLRETMDSWLARATENGDPIPPEDPIEAILSNEPFTDEDMVAAQAVAQELWLAELDAANEEEEE